MQFLYDLWAPEGLGMGTLNVATERKLWTSVLRAYALEPMLQCFRVNGEEGE